MWAKGLLQNWLAFKFRKCFSPAEWNPFETKRTPSAYWNEICLKDPSPSLKVIPTYIFKNVEMASATPLKCWLLWKSTWAEAGEWSLATIVADHSRAAHYSIWRWWGFFCCCLFFCCCRWWHNHPNCLRIACFAIITGWPLVAMVPSTNSIPQGCFLSCKPYWRRFVEKINSAIAAP